MKKGWKRFWIVCIILFGVGIILCAAGALMGGTVEFLSNSYEDTLEEKFSTLGGVDEEHKELHESELTVEELEMAAGDIAGEYADIRSLKADLSYINVILKEYEGTTVKVQTKDIDNRLFEDIHYHTDGDELEIELRNQKKWKTVFEGKSFGIMTVSIPKGSLKEVEFSVGAGTLVIESLHTKELDLKIGAGEALISDLTAKNLRLECGAGETQISGDISGKSKIECGIGTVVYQAVGKESDYDYDLNCGIGCLQVGSMTFEGVIKEQKISNPGATRTMDVSCGIGDVSVIFVEE